MERNFRRGNQRCGYYDEGNLPHGGPERKRRDVDDEDFRYDREDPTVGTKQITVSFLPRLLATNEIGAKPTFKIFGRNFDPN